MCPSPRRRKGCPQRYRLLFCLEIQWEDVKSCMIVRTAPTRLCTRPGEFPLLWCSRWRLISRAEQQLGALHSLHSPRVHRGISRVGVSHAVQGSDRCLAWLSVPGAVRLPLMIVRFCMAFRWRADLRLTLPVDASCDGKTDVRGVCQNRNGYTRNKRFGVVTVLCFYQLGQVGLKGACPPRY